MNRRSAVFLAVALLSAAPVSYDLAPPAVAHAQESNPAAQAVLDAIAADDAERLKELALLDDPDPWGVADELLLRGELDAALRFAQAAPRPDTVALPAYVESRRGREPDAKAREVLASATTAARAGELARALQLLDDAEPAGEAYVAVQMRFLRAGVLAALGRTADSVALYGEVADEAVDLGWLLRGDLALMQAGMEAYRAQEYALGVPHWRRRIELLERRGDRLQLASSIGNTAILLRRLDQYAEALELQQRALAMAVADGHGEPEAANLVNIASTLRELGRYREALDYVRRGHAKAVEVERRDFEINALIAMGTLLRIVGEYGDAQSCLEEALAVVADRGRRASVLTELASVHSLLGSYDQAETGYREALAIRREQGDRYGEATVLGNLGAMYNARGQAADALAYHEQALDIEEALGHREGMARCLLNLGAVRARVGLPEEAHSCFVRAAKLYEEMGNTQLHLTSMLNVGGSLYYMRRTEEALEWQKRVLALAIENGARATEALALGNIGGAYDELGEPERGFEFMLRSFELAERVGDAEDRCRAAKLLAANRMAVGDLEQARKYCELSVERAEQSGSLPLRTLTAALRVGVDAESGRYASAVGAARELVDLLASGMRGFDDVTGADARDQYSNVLSLGTHAAAAAGDLESTVYLLESARAIGLLESLGGRESVSAAVVSAELRLAEATARTRLDEAQAALSNALAERKLREVRDARTAIDVAQREHLGVVERIQRSEKAGADVAYPKAASVSEIQGALKTGQALVLYASRTTGTLAIVFTKDEARVVDLGPIAEPEIPEAAGAKWDVEIARLRRELIEPLGLGDQVKQLLVSPSAVLAFAPFQMLVAERDVVHVPSATAYVRLRKGSEQSGAKVLALGDPAYEKLRGTPAAKIHHGNRAASMMHARLARLPGTRDEALAVGDVTLLGEDASETRLAEEVAKQERWRAVHLACHGLIVPDRPRLSSLAITPDDDSDGALTVLEIMRSRFPADLVVLSACETGRGKVSVSEGVVGFTRAFMVAGAPRVVVSLWKVDDQATSALMTKFYELWKPGGMDTATALRKAQEHVAAQEKWKDPYFWAAWQLWGLPD